MLASISSASIIGIEACLVRVEVDIAGGLPGFATVGLPEATIKEARVRVQAAINNSGGNFPNGKITVNLAPANLRKEGTAFDLPIAIGIMVASGYINPSDVKDSLFFAELSLSGEIRAVRGVLAAADMAKKHGFKRIFIAEDNAEEAALIDGIEIRCSRNFKDITSFLASKNDDLSRKITAKQYSCENLKSELDLCDVKGQYQAKRALEIAAAGGHNLLFIGGPGSGKTMMASRLPGIMPRMNYEEAIEITRIYSSAGLTLGGSLVKSRPFRSPHHTISKAGLIGGGNGIPRPGEISLASNGVLFLDELPEFPKSVLEVLRQPLESKEVIISRASGTVSYPAKFMFVASMNPCPCGYYGSTVKACRCSCLDVTRYCNKISGPLLDRFDLQVDVPPVSIKDLQSQELSESSATVQKRVCQARMIQEERFAAKYTNAQMSNKDLRFFVHLSSQAKEIIAQAVQQMGLSARAYDRVLRVARTIADLQCSKNVEINHLSEAIQYKGESNLIKAA